MKRNCKFGWLAGALAVVLIFTGCKKDEAEQPVITAPIVTTSSITDIRMNTATCGGIIQSDGGGAITQRGICWSISTNPTVKLDTKTNDGRGIGVFTSSIAGLTAGTTYYVRAYAINSVDTSYGENVSFVPCETPVITTSAASIITTNHALTGGIIVTEGGANVTAKGVCWSTSPHPTITQSTIAAETIDGNAFSCNLAGLTANTTYYVRAYATNSVGTTYGNEDVFTTTSGGSTGKIADVDGNVYHYVTINGQVWLVENLKTTKYRNGDPISNVKNDTDWSKMTTGAYCAYNNDANNANTYGYLYNWFAVNDSRSIAPTGWHVATYSEWTALVDFLGGFPDAGDKLKDTAFWALLNSNDINEYGFSLRPSGYRYKEGQFEVMSWSTYVWTSTAVDTKKGWSIWCHTSLGSEFFQEEKLCGNPVRCVRD